jgi:hypothetical protein
VTKEEQATGEAWMLVMERPSQYQLSIHRLYKISTFLRSRQDFHAVEGLMAHLLHSLVAALQNDSGLWSQTGVASDDTLFCAFNNTSVLWNYMRCAIEGPD